jgi:hypothetical protein
MNSIMVKGRINMGLITGAGFLGEQLVKMGVVTEKQLKEA